MPISYRGADAEIVPADGETDDSTLHSDMAKKSFYDFVQTICKVLFPSVLMDAPNSCMVSRPTFPGSLHPYVSSVQCFRWLHVEQMLICPGVSSGNNDISMPVVHRDFLLHPKDAHLSDLKYTSP